MFSYCTHFNQPVDLMRLPEAEAQAFLVVGSAYYDALREVKHG